MPTIRFSVLACVGENTKVGVVGSCAELGNWKPENCVRLSCFGKRCDLKASYWFTDVELPASFSTSDETKPVEFKFIRWSIDGEENSPLILPAPDWQKSFDEKDVSYSPTSQENLEGKVHKIESVEWESNENRILEFTEGTIKSTKERTHSGFYVSQDDFLGPPFGIYCPPPLYFRDIGTSEPELTTRYYRTVFASEVGIDFDWVWPRILVGTVPRKMEHIKLLKEKYGIHSVLNMQAAEDIEKSFPGPDDFPPTRTGLRKLYADEGMGFVNIPTTDFNSEARCNVVSDAAVTIRELLQGCPYNKSVYVHCNAGVGRAIAATCSYLINIQQMKSLHVNHLVSMRRPVAFFDAEAQRQGKEDYDLKFRFKTEKQC